MEESLDSRINRLVALHQKSNQDDKLTMVSMFIMAFPAYSKERCKWLLELGPELLDNPEELFREYAEYIEHAGALTV